MTPATEKSWRPKSWASSKREQWLVARSSAVTVGMLNVGLSVIDRQILMTPAQRLVNLALVAWWFWRWWEYRKADSPTG